LLTDISVWLLPSRSFEDTQRRRSDREINCRKTTVLRADGSLVTVHWSEVVPGNIVRLKVTSIAPMPTAHLVSQPTHPRMRTPLLR